MPAFATAATVRNERLRGQAARDAHHAHTVFIAGVSYACEAFVGGIKLEQLADGSGYVQNQRVIVKIRKAILPTAPARGTQITIKAGTISIPATVISIGGQSLSDVVHVIEANSLPPTAAV